MSIVIALVLDIVTLTYILTVIYYCPESQNPYLRKYIRAGTWAVTVMVSGVYRWFIQRNK